MLRADQNSGRNGANGRMWKKREFYTKADWMSCAFLGFLVIQFPLKLTLLEARNGAKFGQLQAICDITFLIPIIPGAEAEMRYINTNVVTR